MNREELKARLMKEAEQVIDDMLRRKPDAADILLSEIEALAIRSGHSFREAILEELVGDSQEQTQAEAVACPTCGKRMHHKGKRPKAVITAAGEIQLERDYYYCTACRAGVFPPG